LHHMTLPCFTDDVPEIPWYVYVASLVLAGACFWGFCRCRTQLVTVGQSGRFSWEPNHPGGEWPPQWARVETRRPAGGTVTWAVVLVGVIAFGAVVPGLLAVSR